MMPKFCLPVIILFAGLLGGCQYNAKPAPVAAQNVYSSFGSKLPGKYLLFVSADEFNKAVKPSDFNCAAYSYPLNLRSSFSGSIRKTFQALVEQIEVVDRPVDRKNLRARGAKGMIIIRGEDLNARLRVVPGYWSSSIESNVEISASITVDGRRGRLLGSTVGGDGTAQGAAGLMCGGGAESLSESARRAIKEIVVRLGEKLTNSERVRSGV